MFFLGKNAPPLIIWGPLLISKINTCDILELSFWKNTLETPKLVIVHHGKTLPEYIDSFIEQAVFSSPNTLIYFLLDGNLSYFPKNNNVRVINMNDIPKSDLHKIFDDRKLTQKHIEQHNKNILDKKQEK